MPAMLVSLIRGINVGGNKAIPMAALKALYESMGFTRVGTHLNSGNVVFESSVGDEAKIGAGIEKALEKKFGFHAHVVIRTAPELEKALRQNPFKKEAAADPSHLLIMFLSGKPAGAAVDDLVKSHSGPEKFHVVGREAYLCYPEGVGRSKLTNVLIEKKLQVVGTARNWNVVTRLHGIMTGSREEE